MASVVEYQTRPLRTWDKMREMRRKYLRLGWEAHQQGGVIVGSQHPAWALMCGMGLWGRRLYGPYFNKAMQDVKKLDEYHAAADVLGFPRGEMCSSMHHYIGEVLTGHSTLNPWTGEQSPIDFVFETGFCPSVEKMAQFIGERLNVPHFVLDIPQEQSSSAIEYLAGRMQDGIDFMKRVTGKPFDDERLIEGTINQWEQGAIWARICEANKAIPAPLDLQMLFALMLPVAAGGGQREITDYYGEVLAEVEDRVRDGISALGFETVRLSHEGECLFFADDFVPAIVRRYGGVFVTGYAPFCQAFFDISVGGRWTPVPRFADTGVSLRNREDCLAFLSRAFILNYPAYALGRLEDKVKEYVFRAHSWRCHGMVQHMDIGCRSQVAGVLEARTALENSGIPTVIYQGSNSDAMTFSPDHVSSVIQSFLERLGLRPIA